MTGWEAGSTTARPEALISVLNTSFTAARKGMESRGWSASIPSESMKENLIVPFA